MLRLIKLSLITFKPNPVSRLVMLLSDTGTLQAIKRFYGK